MGTNIENSLDALFSKMQGFISTKTVVGDPVLQGGVIIVPLIDVTFGLGVGAADNAKEKDNSNASGGGMGGKISPSAVLVIVDGNVTLVNIKNQNTLNKLIDLAPGILSKLNLDKLLKKKEREAAAPEPDYYDPDFD